MAPALTGPGTEEVFVPAPKRKLVEMEDREQADE